MSFRFLENSDFRVLGAIRFVDATTRLNITSGLMTQCDTARLQMNRAGLFVIRSAKGLETHEPEFLAPPATPALGSVSIRITVRDTEGRYLDRRCSVALPLDAVSGALFKPVDVQLFPSPSSPVLAGWALIRATVTKAASTTTLAGALIRVVRTSDSVLLASGLSDARGEALVAVPGIPITTFSDSGVGAVIGKEIDVTVQTVFDPAAVGAADPDDLEKRKDVLPSSSVSLKLASARVLITNLAVTIP